MTAIATTRVTVAKSVTVDPVDGFARLFLKASADKASAQALEERAYWGLVSYVCHNQAIQAICKVADKLDKRDQLRFLDTISALIGWYDSAVLDTKTGILKITRHSIPLFIIKDGHCLITQSALRSADKELCKNAHNELCKHRISRRPLSEIKIINAKKAKTAKQYLRELVSLYNKIEATKNGWAGTENEATLDSVLQTLADKYVQFTRK